MGLGALNENSMGGVWVGMYGSLEQLPGLISYGVHIPKFAFTFPSFQHVHTIAA